MKFNTAEKEERLVAMVLQLRSFGFDARASKPQDDSLEIARECLAEFTSGLRCGPA